MRSAVAVAATARPIVARCAVVRNSLVTSDELSASSYDPLTHSMLEIGAQK